MGGITNGSAAVACEGLGKAYRIGTMYDRADTLMGTVIGWAKRPFRNARALKRLDTSGGLDEDPDSLVWALRDVSCTVMPGEVIGIIGRNGAGKSTLLKLLARISDPTVGRAVVRGRLASLLEVGTGFHPELSGRENIYMNGAVLGMSRREIDRRFDDIVEFSGVAKFLDTPIKRFSSGMKTRLAFSVAAHLEPDVLIIDEVLAVGDVEFQKRCLGKMESVARSGRTILFVSHNMPAVESLCTRGIVLQGGRMVFDGEVRAAVSRYLREMESAARIDLRDRTDRIGSGEVRVDHIDIVGGTADAPTELRTGAPARFVFHLTRARPDASCTFSIMDSSDYPLAVFDSRRTGLASGAATGTVRVCTIAELPLLPGQYHIDVSVVAGTSQLDRVQSAATFDVLTSAVQYPTVGGGRKGGVFVRHSWSA